MATVTVNGSVQYEDDDLDDSLDAVDFQMTLTTEKYTKVIQSIGTSEEAVDIGELSAIGYVIAVNLDPTNYVELKTATGGTKTHLLKPNGGFAIWHPTSNITAPFAIANTAACRVAFFLCST